MGGSAGGWEAVSHILATLPADYPLPIAVVLHLHPEQGEEFAGRICRSCKLKVVIAADKDPILAGVVTLAPPDYHLLVEWDKTYALSADPKICFSRPSIDALFESAASVYGPRLVGVLLTGASRDGSAGILRIKELGGTTVVQTPETADHSTMPRSAVETASPRYVLPLDQIALYLQELGRNTRVTSALPQNNLSERNLQ
ncbi:MAG: chemotaxis protein CheB [Acidobacteriota bacterium]